MSYVRTNGCVYALAREWCVRACPRLRKKVTEAMIYRVLSLPSNVRENLPLRSLTTAI